MADENLVGEIPAVHPDSGSESALWKRWRTQRDDGARQALLEKHLPYARVIAAKVYAGRTYDEFEFEEYLQFATVALIESLDRYDPELGAQFTTYAYTRMTGAIFNGLEKLSERQQQIGLQRRMRSDRLASIKEGKEGKEDKVPASSQADQLFRYLADVGIGLALGAMLEGSTMFMSEEQWIPDQGYERVELKQLTQRLRSLLTHLTERESQVIQWHYLQSMSFDEIAKRLNISNARVSQLHYQGLQRLRNLFTKESRCNIAW